MTVTIKVGHALDRLREMPSESVHCCVTSPPYWGLRDYGVPPLSWSDGWVGSLGLEPTPAAFVGHLVEIFREVRRALRPDGVLWLNLGDTYASAGGAGHQGKHGYRNNRTHTQRKLIATVPAAAPVKPKDLVGVLWMVAFALRADGWWLRQDVIWSKPNPMPESVTDRCTKSHEYLFMLTKSERYHFDADAIAEPVTASTIVRVSQNLDEQVGSWKVPGKTNGPIKATVKRSGNKRRVPPAERGAPNGISRNQCASVPWEGFTRNKRSVWTVPTVPFDGEFCGACGRFYAGADLRALEVRVVARPDGHKQNVRRCRCGATDAWVSHFATFPPALVVDCVKSSCPVGGTVLDPFGGAGTTAVVADRLGRDAVLVELNSSYAEMARQRLAGDGGMFSDVTKEAAE